MSGFPGNADFVSNFTPIDLKLRRVAISGSVFVPRMRAIIWLRFAGEYISAILAPLLPAQILDRAAFDHPITPELLGGQFVIANEEPRILDGEAELL